MGDAQGQGCIEQIVFFLDENHCGNKHLHAVFQELKIDYEKHTDHFPRGIEDTVWLPIVAKHGWIVLTADARIRLNALERQAIKRNKLRFFYFSRNDFGGAEMGTILRRALPRMVELSQTQAPPFAASISRNSDVTLRDTSEDL
ncbi:hypothetical protein SAMN05421819_2966 [Bryocella elongata]|uniref:VapC45 PIN like domain-containing protein n=1 Tax=Bryocella elongata TaxID=863522 RepID=A0A1H6A8P8_9BACT|nr:hypothetical protein [Bryocella elongata]SEG44427.1 hypothetical protein SAMN05421819_2966 [Bryocella elongata]